MTFYPPPQPNKRRKKNKGHVVQGLFAVLFAIASIATDAFGALPTSPISERFREVLGEAFPLALVEPVNEYLQEISSPLLIVPREMVETEETLESLDENELATLLAEEMVAVILAEQETGSVKEVLTEGIDSKDTPIPEEPSTQTEEPPTVIQPPVVIFEPPQPPPSGPTNTAPKCSAFNLSNSQTTSIHSIDLASLCSDVDGDTWEITNVTQGTNGTTTFAGKTINYNPNDGFAGTDKLSVTMKDSKGNVSTFAFDVIISNSAPAATVDSYEKEMLTAGDTLPYYVLDVLTNDSDPGNDSLTVSGVTTPSHGNAGVFGNTYIYYKPNDNYRGPDSFSYTITDTHGATDTATVNLSIYGKPLACGNIGTGNTTDYDCELDSYILLDGSIPPLYLNSGGITMFLDFNYQVWDTVCPTCSYQILPGLGSSFGGTCESVTSAGAHPGTSSTANITIDVPSTPGTYDLYFNLGNNCSATDYLGSGTSFGQITVCSTPTAQVSAVPCYTGPGANYSVDRYIANTTMWNDLTAMNNDYGPTWYELTSPVWSCWIRDTDILNTTGDVTNCVSHKYVAPPPAIIMYNAGTYFGDIGGRSSADSNCAIANTTGYPNTTAFISIDSNDSIANLPTNNGVPTNVIVESLYGTLIANDWADLLDGTIVTSLSTAGVTASNQWWSGAQADDGSHIDGTTENCLSWTSNSAFDGGASGSSLNTTGWMAFQPNTGCAAVIDLLCIAYP